MLQVRRALVIQATGLVLAEVVLFGLSRVLPLARLAGGDSAACHALGVWSAICYPCSTPLVMCYYFRGVLSVGGGFFFGLWWGFLIVLLGNVIGAAISFFISRLIGER